MKYIHNIAKTDVYW